MNEFYKLPLCKKIWEVFEIAMEYFEEELYEMGYYENMHIDDQKSFYGSLVEFIEKNLHFIPQSIALYKETQKDYDFIYQKYNELKFQMEEMIVAIEKMNFKMMEQSK